MTHVEELFDKYCSKHETCNGCKYYRDKRVTNNNVRMRCCNDRSNGFW